MPPLPINKRDAPSRFKVKPIDLPPPPQPAQANAEATEEFSQRVAEYREMHPRSGLMFVGATVYRSYDHSPRTLIHIWHLEKPKSDTSSKMGRPAM